MKKRILSIFIAFSMILSLSAITAAADESDFTIVDGTLTEYTGTDTEITIPDTVTAIGTYAFDGCTNLESVIIGNGVETISSWAFQNCINLESIIFKGETPPIIGTNAFLDCTALTTVYVPKGFESEYEAITQLSGYTIIEFELCEECGEYPCVCCEICGEDPCVCEFFTINDFGVNEHRPDHVIINQVYGIGSGTRSDTPALSHSFIELYNPTDNDVDLSSCALYYLQGYERGEEHDMDWLRVNLTGKTIASHSSLTILSSVGVEDSPTRASFSTDYADMVVNFPISNRAFSVALVDLNTIAASSYSAFSVKGAYPVKGDISEIPGVIDAVGVTNNAYGSGDVALAYEYKPFDGISMQASARRLKFADYDENHLDFERIDYRTNTSTQTMLPKFGIEGSWGVAIRTDYRIREKGQLEFSHEGGFYPEGFFYANSLGGNVLSLTTTIPNGTIRCTTDGSEPTWTSMGGSPFATTPFNRSGVIDYDLIGAKTVEILIQGTTEADRIYLEDSQKQWDATDKQWEQRTSVGKPSGNFVISRTLTAREILEVAGNLSFRTDCDDKCDKAPGGNRVGCTCAYEITSMRIEYADGFSVLYVMESDTDLELLKNKGGNNWLKTDGNNDMTIGSRGSYKTIQMAGTRKAAWETVDILKDSLLFASIDWSRNPLLTLKAPNAPVGKTMARAYTIKAQVFDATTQEPVTKTFVQTYFVGFDEAYSNMPIVSLTTDGDNLFNPTDGLYTNAQERGRETEKPVHFEIIEPDGTRHSQDMGLRLHGNFSRLEAQKSFRLYARASYDSANPTMRYDLFDGAATDSYGNRITEFNRFLLRQAGSDVNHAMMRDPLLQGMANDLDIINQASRPALLFLNGEFWGYYYIQEHRDDYMVQSHTGISDRDKIGILSAPTINSLTGKPGVYGADATEGWDDLTEAYFSDDPAVKSDADRFLEMHDWFRNTANSGTYNWKTGTGTKMSDAKFISAGKFLDIDNLIELWAIQTITANADFPSGNFTMWRYRLDRFPSATADIHFEDGRFRYLLEDMDMTYNLYESDHDARFIGDILKTMLEESDAEDWPYFGENALYFRKLMTNDIFRDRFLNRVLYLMESNYSSQNITAAINALETNMNPIMPLQRARWSAPAWTGTWESQVARFKAEVVARYDMLAVQIHAYFPDFVPDNSNPDPNNPDPDPDNGGGGSNNNPINSGRRPASTTNSQMTVQQGTDKIIVDIPEAAILSIAKNLPVFQISAKEAGSQTITTAASNAGQNAILMRYNNDTGEFEVVSAATVGADGTVTVNIPAVGDYIVVVAQIGDLTGTGTVTAADALLLLQALTGNAELNPLQAFLSSPRGDRKYTATDALNILKFVAGMLDRI